MSLTSSIGAGAATRRALALTVLVLACGLAGCGRDSGPDCDGSAVEEQVFAAARAQFPSPLTKELMQRGAVNAMEHVLREKGYDRNDKKQWAKAAQEGVAAFEGAYKGGRFTLEDVQTVETDAKERRAVCRARMVVLTTWGIGVRDVSYEAALRDGKLAVKLDPIK